MTSSARKTIEAVITEEVITNAIARDSSSCVVADALKVALPMMLRWSVDLQTIRFSDPVSGKRFIYFTPANAQEILVKFDQGIRPDPGTVIRLTKPAQIVTSSQRSRQRKAEAQRAYAAKQKITGKGRKHIRESDVTAQPTVMGGRLPPLAVLSTRGRRRTFGMKSLKP